MTDLLPEDVTPELIRAEAVKAARTILRYAADPASPWHQVAKVYVAQHGGALVAGLARNVRPEVDNG